MKRQKKPNNFDSRVRIPGLAFLKDHPKPTEKQWKSRNYWIRVKDELYQAYKQICAYSCHWIPPDTGATTFEHFLPKDDYPSKAYEWSNFRLVCATLNGRKGTRSILDPFTVDDAWFELRFPSLLVAPAAKLQGGNKSKVDETIRILGLNDDATCLRSRFVYVRDFCLDHISFDFLKRRAPFIAREIERQGLLGTLPSIMNFS